MDKYEAIAVGIAAAKRQGLDKPHDIAECVIVSLEDAGYRIVRTPKGSN